MVGTVFDVDYCSDLFFYDRSRDVGITTNFMVKMGEIGRLTFIRRLDIPKRIGILQFQFQKVQCG